MRVVVFTIGVLGKRKYCVKLSWKMQNLMVTAVLVFFYDWLTDVECYLDWYGLFHAARVLFTWRKLIGSTKSY